VSGPVPGRTPDRQRPVQGSLFQEKSASNVIPFDSFNSSSGASAKPDPKAAGGQKPASKPAARRTPRVAGAKASWIFSRPFRSSRALCPPRWKPSSAARPCHRFLSIAPWPPPSTGPWSSSGTACSWRRSGSAAALFVLTKPNLLIFGGALLLVGFTYGLFFAIAGTETAGMRWTCLQVITFDGFPPDGGQRLLRFAGACLSLSHAAGPVVVPGRRRGSHLDGPHFPHLPDAPRVGLSSFPPAVSWNKSEHSTGDLQE
jgi:hypothetical protein